jgi:hypothetical protein
MQAAWCAKRNEVERFRLQHILHPEISRNRSLRRMLRECLLVDIADSSQFYVLGMFFERQEVVLGDAPTTDETNTDLSAKDDREVLHEIDALDA